MALNYGRYKHRGKEQEPAEPRKPNVATKARAVGPAQIEMGRREAEAPAFGRGS